MNLDSILWWVGCLISFGAAVFVIWFIWAFVVDQIFRSMKAQKEFIKYLLWKRKQQEAMSDEYDAESILYYAISHAMAGIDAADKQHCELAVDNALKAIKYNKSKFLPLVTP